MEKTVLNGLKQEYMTGTSGHICILKFKSLIPSILSYMTETVISYKIIHILFLWSKYDR